MRVFSSFSGFWDLNTVDIWILFARHDVLCMKIVRKKNFSRKRALILGKPCKKSCITRVGESWLLLNTFLTLIWKDFGYSTRSNEFSAFRDLQHSAFWVSAIRDPIICVSANRFWPWFPICRKLYISVQLTIHCLSAIHKNWLTDDT